jgi:outer membrane biosynthesis protein TonB
MITVDKVIRAAYKLSEPLREKALKTLGLSTKGKPGRKGDGIIVGRDRVRAQKKIDQISGGAKGISAAAILHELLGISSTSKDADKVPTMADIKSAQADDARKDRPKFRAPKTAPSEGRNDSAPMTKPTPKPKRKPMPKTLPKPKPKRQKKKDSGVTFQFETVNKNKGGSVTKSSKGVQDFRKGGMVLSTVDNRKKK